MVDDAPKINPRQFVRLPGLAAARERVGLPLAALARRAGVSLETVRRLERGEHEAYFSTAQRLAEALDVPVEDLIQ